MDVWEPMCINHTKERNIKITENKLHTVWSYFVRLHGNESVAKLKLVGQNDTLFGYFIRNVETNESKNDIHNIQQQRTSKKKRKVCLPTYTTRRLFDTSVSLAHTNITYGEREREREQSIQSMFRRLILCTFGYYVCENMPFSIKAEMQKQ